MNTTMNQCRPPRVARRAGGQAMTLPPCVLAVSLALSCGDLFPPPDPGPPDDPAQQWVDRAGSGSGRATGRVLSASSDEPLPLGGVLVVWGDASAVTRVDGAFDLVGVPRGDQFFLLDGSRVRAADGQYGQFITRLNAADGEVDFERPLYLPFVADAGLVEVPPGRETVLATDDGVTVVIPPGGARNSDREFSGHVSLLAVAPDRTPLPLPAEVEASASLVLTLQPAGIAFPVPLAVSVPSELGGGGGANASLLTLDPQTGAYRDTAFLRRQGRTLTTAAGGIDVAGWHILTDPRVNVVAPCLDGDVEAGRACLRGWMEALDALLDLGRPARPGAAAPFDNLRQVLTLRNRSPGDTMTALTAVRPDFEVARDVAQAAAEFYAAAAGAARVRDAVSRARLLCAGAGACFVDDPADPVFNRIDDPLDAMTANAAMHAARYSRLAAALDELGSYLAPGAGISAEDLPAYYAAADEVEAAASAFAETSSPVDPFDALIRTRNQAEDDLRAIVARVGVPGDAQAEGGARVLRICNNEGARSVGTLENGVAMLSLGESADEDESACIVAALDAARGLCSQPVWQTRFTARLTPPLLLAMDRTMERRALPADIPVAGELSADSPVHWWSLSVHPREGLDVAFAPEGPALAAFMQPDGVAAVARRGGFHVADAPDGRTALAILAVDADETGAAPYALAARSDPARFDFDQPITGALDVMRRAEVVLVEAAAGERIVVERRCCNDPAPTSRVRLLDPVGRILNPAGSAPGGPGGAGGPDDPGGPDGPQPDAAAYDVLTPGLHRVIVTPVDGSFPNYEIVVRKSAPAPPLDLTPGEDTLVTLDAPGQVVTFQLGVGAATAATLVGVASEGVDPALVDVVGPAGESIASGVRLYFDESTFSRREVALPDAGVYLFVFRAPPDAPAQTGRFTIRVETAP